MTFSLTNFCPGPVHPVIWAQWQAEARLEEIYERERP